MSAGLWCGSTHAPGPEALANRSVPPSTGSPVAVAESLLPPELQALATSPIDTAASKAALDRCLTRTDGRGMDGLL